MEGSRNKTRKEFLSQLTGGTLAVAAMNWTTLLQADRNLVQITILHTNDVHSHIDPFDDNHPKYAGMGGVARRAAIIKKIRNEEKNVLLFDAGDIFQGTPYYNMYGGELELKLMTRMGYDAATIGNHDFDNGVSELAKQLVNAAFPMLNCNYNFDGTPMYGKSLPYKLFYKDNIRIGVFGVGIELEGLVSTRLYGSTKYLDPVVKANEISAYLKNRKKCHLVICLSHLGFEYKEDKISGIRLATQSEFIDLIIGGHTHTFMDEPFKINNKVGVPVLITQAGWGGLRMGRIDYKFEKRTGKKLNVTTAMKELIKSSEK